jgi:hypothetical protein
LNILGKNIMFCLNFLFLFLTQIIQAHANTFQSSERQEIGKQNKCGLKLEKKNSSHEGSEKPFQRPYLEENLTLNELCANNPHDQDLHKKKVVTILEPPIDKFPKRSLKKISQRIINANKLLKQENRPAMLDPQMPLSPSEKQGTDDRLLPEQEVLIGDSCMECCDRCSVRFWHCTRHISEGCSLFFFGASAIANGIIPLFEDGSVKNLLSIISTLSKVAIGVCVYISENAKKLELMREKELKKSSGQVTVPPPSTQTDDPLIQNI